MSSTLSHNSKLLGKTILLNHVKQRTLKLEPSNIINKFLLNDPRGPIVALLILRERDAS